MTEPKTWVIDANIILRAVLQDVPEQAARVSSLLNKAEAGDLLLLVPEPVISDVIYVLTGLKVPKKEIAAAISDWLNLPGISLLGVDVDVVHTALDLFFEKNVKWSDALIISRMLEWGYTEICTFDSHFDRIKAITRHHP